MDARQWFVDGQLEVREGRAGEPTMLSGYAAVFNQETVIGGQFRERIGKTAFDAVIDRANTIAAVNHDAKMVLGRTRTGSLKLTVDGTGLRYDVKLPNTTLARDTVENVRNGNYAGSSFKFKVKPDGMSVVEPKHRDDLPLVVINRVEDLIDVGPVTFPAYEQTSVSVRSQEIADLLVAQLAVAIAKRNRQRLRLVLEQAWEV